MLMVASRLSAEGAELHFSSSGEVGRFIRSMGFTCDDTGLIEVAWSDTGRVSVLRTALNFLPDSARFAAQVRNQLSSAIAFGPECVLSDSSLSAVVAGKALSKRVVTVLNQIRLEAPETLPWPLVSLIGGGSEATIGNLWRLSDAILVPDLPPPYTISERNVSERHAYDKVKFVGFLVSGPAPEAPGPRLIERDAETMVYWPVAGPAATRGAFEQLARSVASESSRTHGDKFSFVISLPEASPTPTVEKIRGGWVVRSFGKPTRDELLRLADVAVSRAGHTSIAEFIVHRKPVVLVPIPRQTEQTGNAQKAEKLGVAACLEQQSVTTEGLLSSVESLLNGGSASALERLGRVASKYDAVSEIASEVSRG